MLNISLTTWKESLPLKIYFPQSKYPVNCHNRKYNGCVCNLFSVFLTAEEAAVSPDFRILTRIISQKCFIIFYNFLISIGMFFNYFRKITLKPRNFKDTEVNAFRHRQFCIRCSSASKQSSYDRVRSTRAYAP